MITERQARRRRWTLRVLIVLALLPAVIYGTVPKEPVDTAMTFDPTELGEDPVADFLARDDGRGDITLGAERSVVWAGSEGDATDLVLIYLHGFSATAAEIRPVPEEVAEALGANLIFARLPGHGQSGAALAGPSVADWLSEVDAALAVGNAIGDRVVIIGTSTGATLATLALAHGRSADGLVLISPNFRVANPLAALLTVPGARHWMPPLFGRTRSWTPQNEDHARFWTTSYPTTALFPMAALVEAAGLADHAAITTPALFYFSDADTVVDHRKTREIADTWGGETTLTTVELGPGDDPDNHVIAGDILSPSRTAETVADLAAWIEALR